MKLIKKVVLAAIISPIFLANAYAGDGGTNGLFIGGGTGAILGQAIGHNAESTIVGATAGGLLGYIIGSEIGFSHSRYHEDDNYSSSIHKERARRHRHHRPRIIKEKYRTYHKRDKICQETITIIKKHGKRKRIVSTECWRDRTYSHSPYYSSRRRGLDQDDMGHDHHRRHDRFYH